MVIDRGAGMNQMWLNAIKAAQMIIYLMRDQFSTDASAPISSPRNCEPGPGKMIIVSDTGSRVSISSGKITHTTGGNELEPIYYFDNDTLSGFARSTGLMLRFDIPQYQNAIRLGWLKGKTAAGGSFGTLIVGRTVEMYNSGGQAPLSMSALVVDAAQTIFIVLRSAGCFVFLKNATYSVPTLLWVDYRDNSSPLWPGVSGATGVAATKSILDNLAVRQLTGEYTTDYGIATIDQVSPANGSNYIATANAVRSLQVTLPGSPSLGDYAELRFRRLDDNNYICARVEWNNGTSQWDAKLISVASGTPTVKQTKANVGNVTRIQVNSLGIAYTMWTAVSNTWTINNNSITDSNQSTQIATQVNFQGVAVGRYDDYPSQSSVYSQMDNDPSIWYPGY